MFRYIFNNNNPFIVNKKIREYSIDCTNKSIKKKVEEYNQTQLLPVYKTDVVILHDKYIPFYYNFVSFLSITTLLYYLYNRKS